MPDTILSPDALPLPLPLPIRVANRVDRVLGGGKAYAARFRPESLVRAASRRAGLSPSLPPDVEQALERLCRSCVDEARLHYFGQQNILDLIITGLEALLRLNEHFRLTPSLEQQPLKAPIIVVGLPRSGTTFLHRLLAEIESARTISLFDGLFPLNDRPRWRQFECRWKFGVWSWAAKRYRLEATHYIHPSLPDECDIPLRMGMRSCLFWDVAPTYSYLDWLLQQDLRSSYRTYRRLLQYLQSSAPQKRFVLKSPSHCAWLSELAEVIPEATIVQTHRDPTECIPSECRLHLSTQALSTHHLAWQESIKRNMEKTLTYARRSVMRTTQPVNHRIIHVKYEEIIHRPVELAKAILTHCGIDCSQAVVDKLIQYVRANPQYKRGRVRTSFAQFGLDPQAAVAPFAEYTQTFLSTRRPSAEPAEARRCQRNVQGTRAN